MVLGPRTMKPHRIPSTRRFLTARRLLAACLVAALVGGAGIGIVGIAQAGDEPGAVDLAPRHVGDLGVYERRSDGSPPAEMRFEWLPVQVLFDAEGRPHAAEALEVAEEMGMPEGPDFTMRRITYFDAETGEPLAANLGSSMSAGTAGDTSSSREVLHFRFGAMNAPCGFVVGRDGEGHAAWGCGPEQLPLRVEGKVPWDGGEALVLLHEGDGTTVRIWFVPGVSMPVQVVHRTDGHEEGSRLVSFARGDAPARPVPLPEARSMPPVGHVAVDRLGPDSTGVQHEYGWRDAFAEARDDPDRDEVRAFLAAHDDWYVQQAQAFETRYEDSRTYGWWFVLAAPDGGLSVMSGHHEYDRAPDLAGIPVVGGLQRADERVWHVHERQAPYVAPDERPAALPSPADAQQAWAAYTGTAPEDARLWGFTLCGTYCSGGQVTMGNASEASAIHSRIQLRPADSEDVREETSGVSLVFEDGPTPVGFQAMSQTYERSARQPVPLGGPREPARAPSDDDGIPLAADVGWRVPSAEAAAGLGIGAVLLGVAYWAWPAVKGLPAFGLFSRVRRSRLLEDPLRARMAETIATAPGIHYKELARTVGIGHGAMEHHVAKLEEGGLIVVRRAGGYTCYYPRGTPPSVMAAAGVLKATGARALLEAIRSSPGCTLRAAARAAGLAPASAAHHLRRLREAGIVEAQARGSALSLHAA